MLWPTTLGIVTCGLPDETSMRTSVCLSTFVPSVGFCANTVPSGTSEFETRRTCGTRPRSWIRLSAFACGMPTTYGTATCWLPWTWFSIQSRASQAPRSTARTSPSPTSHGHSDRPRLGGSYFGGPRRTTWVAAVASSTRSPASTIVAASAVSAATRPPRATVSRSASIAAADW